jgi:hypothetical protein
MDVTNTSEAQKSIEYEHTLYKHSNSASKIYITSRILYLSTHLESLVLPGLAHVIVNAPRITCLLSLHSSTLRVSNSQFVMGITEGKHGGISSPTYILPIFPSTTWLIPFS